MPEKPTASNLAALLAECAANAPASFRDQRVAWGFSAAGTVLTEARQHGLGAIAEGLLEQLLRSDNADEVWLAMTFLPLDRVVALGLPSLDQTRWHGDVRQEWRVKMGTAVSRGLVPYTTAMRAERTAPGGRAFIPAILAYDHAWFWQNITTVLGKRASDVKFELSFALGELTRSEAQKLKGALPSAGLPPDVTAAMQAALDEFDATGTYAVRATDRF